MSTNIKCPKCDHGFPLEEVVSEEYKKELRQEMVDYKKKKEDELQRKEQEWIQASNKKEAELLAKVQAEKTALKKELEEGLRKSIQADFQGKLQFLEASNKDNEIKITQARNREMEFLQREKEFKNKEAELELAIARKLQQERVSLTEEIRKIEQQKTETRETDMLMRQKELEKQLDDQKKLVEEMKRKSEQGSMQLQGEVQELALEKLLKDSFPFDVVCEVGKGVKGADCLLTIRNNFGQECGKIIFESKRTKDFGPDWIEKLKRDMRAEGADLGVIVTQAMPKGMQQFGDKEGIWICTYAEAKALVNVLRDGVIKIFNAAKKHENKGDKMHLLYDYLTSNEFAEQWKAVREGFLSMKLSIQRERDAMEKLWKSREKQLEKILLNTAYIKGSVEGIAGQDTIDLNLIADEEEMEETPQLTFK
ncbi:MAG: hypothetical protein JWP69_853 [Flaviaesturariibacter sp.]|nr:hypothetical protein [Flaviaesturariibacter sp.]